MNHKKLTISIGLNKSYLQQYQLYNLFLEKNIWMQLKINKLLNKKQSIFLNKQENLRRSYIYQIVGKYAQVIQSTWMSVGQNMQEKYLLFQNSHKLL
ncbi:unnamed protein product [Paramecium primaurelia]|uniref:Uncharacterized protein n=1 Tax=Paramecium primaurelia TaxID=5886 RepID=A0A8S1JTN5_PARPR|nr:unnamed protein product [Paramecium primaurelia]